MGKYVEERIKEIERMTLVDIPSHINNGIDIETYIKYRITLNLTVIQAVFGAEIEENQKMKFKHRIANSEELLKISHLMNDFVNNYEYKYISFNVDDDDDDMDIPRQTTNLIPKLEKVNNKMIKDYVFSDMGISKMFITGLDIYELALTASKIKKTKNRNLMLIIAGITLVVAGGTIAIVYTANKNKGNEDSSIDLDSNDIDLDNNTIDLDDDQNMVSLD